jgi:hypothetical protein
MADHGISRLKGNTTYIIMGLVIVILIAVLYFALAGGGAGPSATSSGTTAGQVSHQSTYASSATTTVAFNASQYTTTPPVANSTITQPATFLAFVPSSVVNSILVGEYNQSNTYSNSDGYGINGSYSENYNSSGSNVTITLSQFNTTDYAYSSYNQTYNGFYAWAKQYGLTFYSSTYNNASYLIANISSTYQGNTITLYESIALYGNYIIVINATQINSKITTPQLERLTEAEIGNVSGHS